MTSPGSPSSPDGYGCCTCPTFWRGQRLILEVTRTTSLENDEVVARLPIRVRDGEDCVVVADRRDARHRGEGIGVCVKCGPGGGIGCGLLADGPCSFQPMAATTATPPTRRSHRIGL
jgi:hypothetical protein